MAEENLFGNFSLDDGMIDIPEPGETVAATTDTTKPDKVDKKGQEGINDVTFEVPDNASTQVNDTTDNKEVEDNPETNKGKVSSSSQSPFLAYAKALNESGVITSFEEEKYQELVDEMGSEADALIELNRRTIESEIEAYKEEGEAEYAAFLEARDNGVDLNDWAQVQDNKKKYAKIADEDLESNDKLQKQLVSEDLKKRGMSDDEIVDTLEAYEDTNKLGNMAKRALKSLKKYEDDREEALKNDAKQREIDARNSAKKQIEDLKKEVTKIDEIIPGAKLNKQMKDKLLQVITAPVKTLDDGRQLNAVMLKRSEDPIKYAIMEAYFVEQGFFDGKFEKFVAKAKSNAVKDLEKQISGDTDYKAGKAALNSSGSDDFNDKEFAGAFGRVAR